MYFYLTQVVDLVTRGCMINLLGLGSTLLGIQALVGVLVAKTLSNATANPFIASAAGVYNPVLALDVFLVQVCEARTGIHAHTHIASAAGVYNPVLAL